MFRMTMITYALHELASRKGRSCAVIAGMSVGIALYVAFATLSDGYKRLVRLPFSQLSADITIQVPSTAQTTSKGNGIRLPVSNQPIRGRDVQRIAGIAGIKAVSGSVLLWNQSRTGFVIVQGIDTEDTTLGAAKVQEWVIKGRKLKGGAHEALLEEHFARFNRKHLGESIELGGRQFSIVGIVQQKEGSNVSSANAYIPIDDARVLGHVSQDSSNMLFAKLEAGEDPDIVRKRVARVLPGAIVSSADNIGEMMKGFGAISGSFSTTMGILSLLFAAIVTYRILLGSVNERAAEIGIMKAVGWKRIDVTVALMAETFFLGLLGALAGAALGYAGAWGLGSMKITLATPWNLNPVPAGVSHTAAMNLHSVAIPVSLSLETVALALAVSVLISGLTGVVVARNLAARKVMEALRHV
jgi:putative ABC transport system permease protein